MKTEVLVRLVAVSLLCGVLPCPAWADCTLAQSGANNANGYASMYGEPGSYVATAAQTTIPFQTAPCNDGVQAEAWVNPGGNPVVTIGGTSTQATAYVQGYVYGYWTGGSKSWYFYQDGGARQYVLVYQGSPAVDFGPDPVQVCYQNGGFWDTSMDPPGCNYSPIVINLSGNGHDHLTSPGNGVWFDINAHGTPERVAWTKAGSDVGFLVLDRNGNGIIDDGSELFGTATVRRDGTRAANGFDALLDLDGGAGISDGKISGTDAVYRQLRVWVDTNHNGFSEPDELFTLESLGITTIYTSYTRVNRTDVHGNVYAYEGTALIRNRHGVDAPRTIFDVFLTHAQ